MMPLTYGSVCSGIEAASVAWHCLGWQPAWFAEIEKFPSAVLAYRWPDVVNLGDMTKIAEAIRAGKIQAPDILVGGTPCQAFSVAGLRNGLADERGQLTLAFVELVNAIDEKRREQGKPPVIVVWENVPGVFSSKDNAFGCFLAGLAGESCALESPGKKWSNAGYVLGPERAICWRVLDAQFFGVAQRRRRVFVVASARTDIDPAKILFESEGMRRDTPPSREKRESDSAHVGDRFVVGSHWDGANYPHPTLNQCHNTGGIGQSNQELFSQRGCGIISMAHGQGGAEIKTDDSAPYLALAFAENSQAEVRLEGGDGQIVGALSTGGGKPGQGYPAVVYGFKAGQGAKAGGIGFAEEQSPTLTSASSGSNLVPAVLAYSGFDILGTPASEVAKETDVHTPLRARIPGQFENSTVTMVANGMAVRRLTPVECERLQGFPDNHTLIPVDKRKQVTADEYAYLRHHFPNMTAEKAYRLAAEGPRYKAIGNSMAVPVMRWIGTRIQEGLCRAH